MVRRKEILQLIVDCVEANFYNIFSRKLTTHYSYLEIADFETIVMNIELEPATKGPTVVLNYIFFDADKYDLKDKSLVELQKIIRLLNDSHPSGSKLEAY